LALAARALTNGEKVAFSGPLYDSCKGAKGAVVVRFKGAAAGLAVPGDGPLQGLTRAGENRPLGAAAPETRADLAAPSRPRGAAPTAVRYAWADRPIGNLADGDALPAAPFRTDDFPLSAAAPTAAVRPLFRRVPDAAIKVAVPGVQQPDNYSCGAAVLM